MASLPPLPRGATLIEDSPSPRRQRRDPWEILQADGFTLNNGYRTQGDQERIRQQGYNPAPNSDHLRGDAMDLGHPTLSPRRQHARARQLLVAEGWDNPRIVYHDGHLHVGVPGWRGAPGTPGTRNFGLPPLPHGAELVQRGNMAPGNYNPGAGAPSTAPSNGIDQTALLEAARVGATAVQGLLPGGGHPDDAAAAQNLAAWNGSAPPAPAGATPAPPPASAPNPAYLPNSAVDRSAPLPGRPSQPLVRPTMVQGRENDPRLAGVNERSSELFANGASASQIAAAWREAGVPASVINATMPRLRSIVQWGRRQTPARRRELQWDMDNTWSLQGVPEDQPAPLPEQPLTAPEDDPARGDLNRQMGLPGTPGAATYGSFVGPGGVEYVATPENVARYPEYAVSTRGQQEEDARTSAVAQSMQGAEFRAPAPRGFFGRAADAARDTFREYTPAAALARWLQRNIPSASDYRANDTRTPEQIQADRSARVTAEARERRAQIALREQGDPADSLTDHIADFGGSMVGGAAGDPTTLLMPGRTIVQRMIGTAAIGGGVDATLQGVEMAEGVRDEYSPTQTIVSTAAGPVLIGGGRAVGNVARAAGIPVPSGAARDRTRAEARGAEPQSAPAVAPEARSLSDLTPDEQARVAAEVVDGGERTIYDEASGQWRAETPEERAEIDQAIANELTASPPRARDRVEAMEREDADAMPSVSSDVVTPATSRSAAGDLPLGDHSHIGRPDAGELADIARGIDPEDVLPRPRDAASEDAAAGATPYDALPEVTQRVGNIDLSRIESADDISRLLQTVEERFGGFDAARRGRISHDETRALAEELGMTADDLLRRRPGQALNAEQALAARSILAKSSDEVLELARRASSGASEADRAAFAEALLRHAAIHEQVSGAVSEAGRALSSLRAAARSRAVSGRIHEVTVQGMGGQNRLEDIADRILDLQERGVGPGERTRFAVDAIKPRFSDKLVELWYNSLLSGPQTHIVNMVGNTVTSAMQIPEQAIASAIGQVQRGARRLRGKPDEMDRILSSEIGARIIGMWQGAREGLGAAYRTFRTGEVTDQVTKVESRVQEAIPGRVGQVIRTPTRLLASEDEFFKAVARRMELNALATRQASSERLRGQARRDRIAELVANPPDEMLERAFTYARYLTFQRQLQGIPADVSRWTQNHPWMKLFLPFVRTPTNLFRHAIERSPAAPILREVRSDFRAGGERRAVALARMAMGTGIAWTVSGLAQQGIITGGGPADRGARELMMANGWQPYSIKIGDTYYSYARMDPLSTTLGVAADMVEYQTHMTEAQQERSGALLVTAIIRNIGNKTWLSGVTDLVSAVEDPGRYGENFVARLAGSIAVPALFAQIARSTDPVLREARSPIDRIISRIPGLSQTLEPRRDAFGRVVENEGGLGPDALTPFRTRQAQNDRVVSELLSIGSSMGRPSRKVQGRELTAEEYGRYQEISGRYIYEDLRAAIADPAWPSMSVEERREQVDKIKRDGRADARADLALDAPPLPAGAEAR